MDAQVGPRECDLVALVELNVCDRHTRQVEPGDSVS